MTKPNPEKHLHVLAFILEYKARHDGNSPTVREIREACDISSTSVVYFYLTKLEDEGYITRPRPHRGDRAAAHIEVVGGHWKYAGVRVPEYKVETAPGRAFVMGKPYAETIDDLEARSRYLQAIGQGPVEQDPYGPPTPDDFAQLSTVIGVIPLLVLKPEGA